jgi:alanine dehydrogenase
VPVLVEIGAGIDSGIGDGEYRAAGVAVLDRAVEVWERADLVCKVKEPQVDEVDSLRPGLVLLAYLHLASLSAEPGVLAEPGSPELQRRRRVLGQPEHDVVLERLADERL